MSEDEIAEEVENGLATFRRLLSPVWRERAAAYLRGEKLDQLQEPLFPEEQGDE